MENEEFSKNFIKGLANPESIEPEALDFIYTNAVSYLETIHKSMEAISNRSLVLLSYLMIAVGFAATHVISSILDLTIKFEWTRTIFVAIGIFFVLYYIRIIWRIVHYSKPRWANVAYSQPNDMLTQELNLYGNHMIKFVRCIELQKDIIADTEIMTDMFQQFEIAIDKAFIFPIVFKKRNLKK